jgi:hypothetical protein
MVASAETVAEVATGPCEPRPQQQPVATAASAPSLISSLLRPEAMEARAALADYLLAMADLEETAEPVGTVELALHPALPHCRQVTAATAVTRASPLLKAAMVATPAYSHQPAGTVELADSDQSAATVATAALGRRVATAEPADSDQPAASGQPAVSAGTAEPDQQPESAATAEPDQQPESAGTAERAARAEPGRTSTV